MYLYQAAYWEYGEYCSEITMTCPDCMDLPVFVYRVTMHKAGRKLPCERPPGCSSTKRCQRPPAMPPQAAQEPDSIPVMSSPACRLMHMGRVSKNRQLFGQTWRGGGIGWYCWGCCRFLGSRSLSAKLELYTRLVARPSSATLLESTALRIYSRWKRESSNDLPRLEIIARMPFSPSYQIFEVCVEIIPSQSVVDRRQVPNRSMDGS